MAAVIHPLTYRAAYLHYVEGLPQKEVAGKLGLSTATISRLIRQAREEGLVQVSLRDPYADYFELEKKVQQRYGLREVIVARVPRESPSYVGKAAIAREGADYLQRVIRDGNVIGVAWGSTVYGLVDALNPTRPVRADWVALHGSLSKIPYQHDVSHLVQEIAQRFNGNHLFLNFEAILDSRETVDAVLRESGVRAVFAAHQAINVSVVGIGAFYPKISSSLASAGYLTHRELEELKAVNVVGDMILRFFNAQGVECETSLADRTVSIALETYKRIPLKIAVAGGVSKIEAVRSALRGGLVDVLVTEPLLAEGLLSSEGGEFAAIPTSGCQNT